MTRKMWAGSGILALVLPVVLGCGGESGTGTSGSSENPSESATSGAATSPGGAPGGPVGTKPGGAAQGSPIRVPAFTAAGGSLQNVETAVNEALVDACGDGTLCVKVKFVLADENDDNCHVAGSDPSPTVRRNSELTVTIACTDKAGSHGDGDGSSSSSSSTTTSS